MVDSSKPLRILRCPLDGGGAIPGSFLGPEAILFAHLEDSLKNLKRNPVEGIEVIEWEAETPYMKHQAIEDDFEPRLKNPHQLLPCAKKLAEATRKSIEAGEIPIVLGGDHSLSVGSIAGALQAVEEWDVAVLWIDAHADINSPISSTTGHTHGMPLGSLVGREGTRDPVNAHYWDRLSSEVVGARKLNPESIAWVGLRDVDEGEAKFIVQHKGSFYRTMQDVDREGIGKVMDDLEVWLDHKPRTKLWVSFDVDVLDPILAPGTGTTVRGGMTYREGHFIAERLNEILGNRLIGLDVVEVNPLMDHANATASVASEWIASLFGKRILPRFK